MLLRAVGHVLHKVDAPVSNELREVVADWWNSLKDSKPKPSIYWEFIEKERNAAIKEYRLIAGLDITITPATTHLEKSTLKQTASQSIPTQYDYLIKEGEFKGRLQKEVLEEAIAWWDAQLTDIEELYEGKMKPNSSARIGG